MTLGAVFFSTATAGYTFTEIPPTSVGAIMQAHALDNGQLYFNAEVTGGSNVELFSSDGQTHTKLTDDVEWDKYYAVEDGKYVWGNGRTGLFYFDGTSVINLNPRNLSMGSHASLSNGVVVWAAYDGNDTEIFMYKDGITTQITNNTITDDIPTIDNDQIVWQSGPAYSDFNIMLWNAGVVTQITTNGKSFRPIIENGTIVWTGVGVDDKEDIFMYKAGVTTNLSNSAVYERNPKIDNGMIVWERRYHYYTEYRYSEEWYEIMLFNGHTVSSISGQDKDYTYPAISNGEVVFKGTNTDVYQQEIYHWRTGSMTQVTNSTHYKVAPVFEGTKIAWAQRASLGDNSVIIAERTTFDETAQYKIVSKHSGKVLDASGGLYGSNVQQWDFHGGDNQLWTISEDINGIKVTSVSSGLLLESSWPSYENGVNVDIWGDVNGLNQYWNLNELDDGSFSFINRRSEKAMDVAEFGTWNGANIHQWDYVGGANQQWFIEKVPTFEYVWMDEDANTDGAWAYSHSTAPAEYNYLVANEWGNLVMSTEHAHSGSSSMKFYLDHNTASFADAFIPTSASGTGVEPTASDYEQGKDLSGATEMSFWVKGAPGSQFSVALLMDDNRNTPAVELTDYITGITWDNWTKVTIPMADFAGAYIDFSRIEKVWLRQRDTHPLQQMVFFVDAMKFTGY